MFLRIATSMQVSWFTPVGVKTDDPRRSEPHCDLGNLKVVNVQFWKVRAGKLTSAQRLRAVAAVTFGLAILPGTVHFSTNPPGDPKVNGRGGEGGKGHGDQESHPASLVSRRSGEVSARGWNRSGCMGGRHCCSVQRVPPPPTEKNEVSKCQSSSGMDVLTFESKDSARFAALHHHHAPTAPPRLYLMS